MSTKKKTRGSAADRTAAAAKTSVDGAERERLIAETAYLRAAARNFAQGDCVHDWLEAEREIDARLTKRS